MSTTINKKLELTEYEYEMFVFDTYFRWCQSVTITDADFQKILANTAVNKWFWTEFTKCEEEFNKTTRFYDNHPTVTAGDFRLCYAQCTSRMFNLRPMPLLEAAKKVRIENPPLNSN